MGGYAQTVIFFSIWPDYASEWIDNINLEIDFIFDNNQVTIWCELNFCCVKSIQSYEIEHFKRPGIINTDAVLATVFLEYGQESPRMRASTKRVSIGRFEFIVFDVTLLLCLKVINDTMWQSSIECNDLIGKNIFHPDKVFQFIVFLLNFHFYVALDVVDLQFFVNFEGNKFGIGWKLELRLGFNVGAFFLFLERNLSIVFQVRASSILDVYVIVGECGKIVCAGWEDGADWRVVGVAELHIFSLRL